MSNVKIELLEKAVVVLQEQLKDAQDDIEGLAKAILASKLKKAK